MSHELGTHDSWLSVMHDLCRWTSKERQAELARNEGRVRRESHENSLAAKRASGRDTRRTWNTVRSASRRGVVKSVEARKDFSWETYEREERKAGAYDHEIASTVEWVNWQSERLQGK